MCVCLGGGGGGAGRCRQALSVSKLSALADGVKGRDNYSALTCHHVMCVEV